MYGYMWILEGVSRSLRWVINVVSKCRKRRSPTRILVRILHSWITYSGYYLYLEQHRTSSKTPRQISEGRSTKYPTDSVKIRQEMRSLHGAILSRSDTLLTPLEICKIKRSHRIGDFLDRGNLRTFHSIRDATLSHMSALGLLALV